MAIFFTESPELKTLKKNMAGSKGLPLVGHGLDLITNPKRMGLKLTAELGPVYWANALGITFVSLMGPDANQFVLRNQDDVFSSHQGWDFYIGKFFNRGIMLLDFEEHRHHRGIMQAAFKKNGLVQYLARMNPALERGMNKWKPSAKFEIFTHIKKLTLDLATDIFMGEKIGPEADAINKAFVDCVRAGTALVRFPVPGGRWKKGLDGRRLLEKFFYSRIAEKRNNPGEDLFSKLCHAADEHGNKFSDEDVVNHMIFLMMAAHDTTTITLCSMLYQLAKNPEWQERLRQESLALGKRDLAFDDLAKLESAGLVMKEALRLIPPVPGIPRKTVKAVEFAGYHIPAGTMVSISTLVSHHMHTWWAEPARFDPERFSDERAEHKKHPYQYMPFGGGAHMCIGLHFAEMQVKAVLHHMLQRYRFSVNENYKMPVDYTSLPVPADKLPVRLERL